MKNSQSKLHLRKMVEALIANDNDTAKRELNSAMTSITKKVAFGENYCDYEDHYHGDMNYDDDENDDEDEEEFRRHRMRHRDREEMYDEDYEDDDDHNSHNSSY